MSLRLLLSMIVLALNGWIAAQSVAAADDYGDAVRAYFAQDYQSAHDRLSAAIAGGLRDARCYFFRGLASHKLNRSEAAIADFKTGAGLEIAGFGVDVGRALERVQGPERLELERHRRLARLMARYRQQSPAPAPIAREARQRLARRAPPMFPNISEIPSANDAAAGATDPFVDDRGGDSKSEGGAVTFSEGGDDRPVGTGVAAETDENDSTNPFGEEADAFAEIPGLTKDKTSKPGIFGSMFRAFGKALAGGTDSPAVPSQDAAADDSSDFDFLDEEPF